jgi:hypothetical protein
MNKDKIILYIWFITGTCFFMGLLIYFIFAAVGGIK